MRNETQRGVTLPELLIALLVFAMISGAAVYALRLSVEGREQLEKADAEIREFQIARQIIKQDLGNLVDRVQRDEFGAAFPASFIGGNGLAFRPLVDGERTLMIFVRSGWTNPDDRAPRASLQAVEYLMVDDKLVRRTRPYLDDARGQPRNDRVLLSDVADVKIEFFTGVETGAGFSYVELWPIGRDADAAPASVRLTMTTRRFGVLEQLFRTRMTQ